MKIKLFMLILLTVSSTFVTNASPMGYAAITLTGVVTESNVPEVAVGQKFLAEMGVSMSLEEFRSRTFNVYWAVDLYPCPYGDYTCVGGGSTPYVVGGGIVTCSAFALSGVLADAGCEGTSLDNGSGYFNTSGFGHWPDHIPAGPASFSGIVTDTRIQFLPEPGTGFLIGLTLLGGTLASRGSSLLRYAARWRRTSAT